jgi:hypothetical protein
MTDAVRSPIERVPASQDVDIDRQRESDLLGRWQASPTGQVAHDVFSLINVVNDLTALAAVPAGMKALDWEGEDLLAAHTRLGRLLLRVSAHRADQ